MKDDSTPTRVKPPTLPRPLLRQRKRGRPARISREAIIKQSMEILATTYVDDFMVKAVAEQLGTGPMAIYNYFASREALLEAVADEVCLGFKPPKPKADWRETLVAWLWALKRHADRYPVIHNIIGIDGRISAGWFRIAAPIVKLLSDIGLREKKLALASYLFMSNAASLIYIEASNADTRKAMSFAHFERLSSDEQQLMIAHGGHVARLTEKDVLDAGFAQLIRGIEQFL